MHSEMVKPHRVGSLEILGPFLFEKFHVVEFTAKTIGNSVCLDSTNASQATMRSSKCFVCCLYSLFVFACFLFSVSCMRLRNKRTFNYRSHLQDFADQQPSAAETLSTSYNHVPSLSISAGMTVSLLVLLISCVVNQSIKPFPHRPRPMSC